MEEKVSKHMYILLFVAFIIFIFILVSTDRQNLEYPSGMYVYTIEDLEGMTHSVSYSNPVIIDNIPVKSLTLVAEGVSLPENK